jgi:hypothetical protein
MNSWLNVQVSFGQCLRSIINIFKNRPLLRLELSQVVSIDKAIESSMIRKEADNCGPNG